MDLTKDLQKKQNKFNWQLILILIVAVIFRLYLLDMKPAHHDEGVNGWFLDQITKNHFYIYDPKNYHGPLHFYIMFVFQHFLGRANWIIRLPTALISILSVYWIFLFSRFIGQQAALIAACGMAISPAFVYFGRFAIHEADLVFFLILILWGFMGLYYEGKTKYLWALGIGISGTILTKETYIVHFICFVLAWGFLRFLEDMYPSEENRFAKQQWAERDLYLVFFVCVGLIVFFYSGNFLNFKGLHGIYQTFQEWLSTGNKAGGHAKPFLYWFNLCKRYELIALLGLIFSPFYLSTTPRMIRYTAIYGLGTFIAYSIIPYKTPWCIISIIWPFYLTFGDIVSRLLKTNFYFFVYCTLIILILLSTTSSIKLNFINYCSNKEQYVYVHTFKEISKITDPLFKLAKNDHTQYSNLKGIVLSSDEWPLPWTLGDFTMIAYYNINNLPKDTDADFLFVEKKHIGYIESKLKNEYFTESFPLRDAQESSKLYLSYTKFKNIFPDRKPEFLPSMIISTPVINNQSQIKTNNF